MFDSKKNKKKTADFTEYEANYDYTDVIYDEETSLRQEYSDKRVKTIAILFCYLLFVIFGGLTTPFIPNEGAQILPLDVRWDRVLFQTLQSHYHILNGMLIKIDDVEMALEDAQTENDVFAVSMLYAEIAKTANSNLPQARASADIRPQHAGLARQMVTVYEHLKEYSVNMENALLHQDEEAFEVALSRRDAAFAAFVLFETNLRSFSDLIMMKRDPVLFGDAITQR